MASRNFLARPKRNFPDGLVQYMMGSFVFHPAIPFLFLLCCFVRGPRQSQIFFLPTTASFLPTLFWGFSGPPALSYKTYSVMAFLK